MPEIEPIPLDDDIAIEDISKDKNVGKQSASSSETSTQPRAHHKRGRDTYDEESGIKTISEKLGQVANAITRLICDRLNVQALPDEVMKMKGFDEAFLGSAFDWRGIVGNGNWPLRYSVWIELTGPFAELFVWKIIL